MGVILTMRRIASCLLRCLIVPAAPMQKEKEFTNSIGMRLIRIESGAFLMGFEGQPIPVEAAGQPWRVNGDFDERPAHRVKIAKAFYLGAFEVTNAQYEQLAGVRLLYDDA